MASDTSGAGARQRECPVGLAGAPLQRALESLRYFGCLRFTGRYSAGPATIADASGLTQAKRYRSYHPVWFRWGLPQY
jgi:hypothetical protein